MFASFLWTVLLVTVCRADGSAMEHRLKPFWSTHVAKAVLEEGVRRRDGGEWSAELDDGVTHMAAQAGFRYKSCISESPFGGWSKRLLVNFAPAILGKLMDFSTERRRWGFNKNNFITNIAQPLQLQGVTCESMYQYCNLKAMVVFHNGLNERKTDVMNSYRPFVTNSNIDYFVTCALEEITQICSEYKQLVCNMEEDDTTEEADASDEADTTDSGN